MNTTNTINKNKSTGEILRGFGRASVAMAVITALCLSLNCNLAQARINLDPGDDPVGDGGGGGPAPAPPPPRQIAPPPSYAAWTSAHGGSDNSGFARVVTVPAVAPSAVVDVGPVAPGANPVTGRDGTVYIGNLNGELVALHPDGSLYWKRKLEKPDGGMFGAIHASPVISEDGSIFVVSGYGVRDHRDGALPYSGFSFLHKFTPGGGWVGWTQFPEHYRASGATKAPPNIWKYNGSEVIMIPVQFGNDNKFTQLVAFSTSLGVLGDLHVSPAGDITGEGPGWWNALVDTTVGIGKGIYCLNPVTASYHYIRYGAIDSGSCDGFGGFTTGPYIPADNIALYSYLGSPYGVAIRQRYADESPHIFVVDGLNDTVELWFDVNTGFHPILRTHNAERVNLSPPVALPWGIVIGKHTPHESLGGISFEPEQRYLWLDGDIMAAPTVTPNGRIAAVANTGWLSTVIQGGVEDQLWNNGASIASAASSCTHLFVAVKNELVTYDLASMQPVFRFAWTNGGNHSTIIGPLGHVYATTEHGIYVFPPEPNRDPKVVTGTQCT
ncbi:MAG: hypothetical protein WAW61_13545 [Methylococcaceae bacterium]